MSGKKKKKQATLRRAAKQTAQKPKTQTSRASSKQEPKQTSRASSKPNTPKTSNNQSSKANNKTTSKQEPKQTSRASSEQDISVVIKKHDDKNNGHPHVILEDFEGDKHVSVGLTTQKHKGTNSTGKNYRLEKDPLGEVKESYMRRQGTIDLQKNYSNPRKGKLTKKDYERALLYGQRAKEKYLKKQQEKKKT